MIVYFLVYHRTANDDHSFESTDYVSTDKKLIEAKQKELEKELKEDYKKDDLGNYVYQDDFENEIEIGYEIKEVKIKSGKLIAL